MYRMNLAKSVSLERKQKHFKTFKVFLLFVVSELEQDIVTFRKWLQEMSNNLQPVTDADSYSLEELETKLNQRKVTLRTLAYIHNVAEKTNHTTT